MVIKQVSRFLTILQYYELDSPKEIDANFNMKDIDISVFTQFIPNWFKLEGLVSGNIHLGGLPNKTKFDFDLNIEDAMFENLRLGSVKTYGLYNSNKFILTDFLLLEILITQYQGMLIYL